MLSLVNNRELMGDLVNSKGHNIVVWSISLALILLTVLLVFTPFIT
jgi:Mn2+/Fe2+ NRAMP family transporter